MYTLKLNKTSPNIKTAAKLQQGHVYMLASNSIHFSSLSKGKQCMHLIKVEDSIFRKFRVYIICCRNRYKSYAPFKHSTVERRESISMKFSVNHAGMLLIDMLNSERII